MFRRSISSRVPRVFAVIVCVLLTACVTPTPTTATVSPILTFVDQDQDKAPPAGTPTVEELPTPAPEAPASPTSPVGDFVAQNWPLAIVGAFLAAILAFRISNDGLRKTILGYIWLAERWARSRLDADGKAKMLWVVTQLKERLPPKVLAWLGVLAGLSNMTLDQYLENLVQKAFDVAVQYLDSRPAPEAGARSAPSAR